jgi:amino acid transporter
LENQKNLKRVLSLTDATMINAGGIIGSGIFMVPATVALYTQSSSLFFLVWFLGARGINAQGWRTICLSK